MRVEKPGPSDVTDNLPTVHGSPVPEWRNRGSLAEGPGDLVWEYASVPCLCPTS
jgi:hypothetical protein